MLDDIRLTKTERALINRAFNSLEQFTRSRYELDNLAAQERRGYGNPRDRVPLIVARALIVKWFMRGASNPDALLRDFFAARPAAVYATGLGARATAERKLHDPAQIELLASALAAYDRAFDAMHKRDLEALKKMQTQSKPEPVSCSN